MMATDGTFANDVAVVYEEARLVAVGTDSRVFVSSSFRREKFVSAIAKVFVHRDVDGLPGD